MSQTALSPSFRKRMLPLAILTGLLVGVGLPTLYGQGLQNELDREAQSLGEEISSRLQLEAQRRPGLWVYDPEALDSLILPFVEANPDLFVEVHSAWEKGVYAAGPERNHRGRPVAVSVKSNGRTVALVTAFLHDEGVRQLAKNAWVFSIALGSILALALYFLPVSIIRRGDVNNTELWSQLEAANAQLEDRVQMRTQALQDTQVELRELGMRLVEVQESERARISRNLHDDLGQTLTALRLRLTTIDALLPSGSPVDKHLNAAIDAIDEGVDQVRALAQQLRPPALDKLGLGDALDDLCEQSAARYDLNIDSEIDSFGLDADLAEALFRTAQEAFTNIARHANAKRVKVALRKEAARVTLSIEDDGKGTNANLKLGLGLIGIRERLVNCGGRLTLGLGKSLGGLQLMAEIPVASEGSTHG